MCGTPNLQPGCLVFTIVVIVLLAVAAVKCGQSLPLEPTGSTERYILGRP